MILLSRREMALGALVALAPASAAAAPPARLAFAAYRNGRRIGEHAMDFARRGEELVVRTQADMAVKLGPVTVFRYRHEAEERWRGERFEALATRTSSTGSREAVSARRTPSGVVIQAADSRALAPAEAAPFTHWNLEAVRRPLFNPQTGKLLKLRVRDLGTGPVALADGRRIEARRIGFSGDAEIEDWYDEAGVWTALRGKLDDGSTMEYRRL